MDLELEQSRFLVTGASRGIGLAIAQRLLHEGAKVAIIARQEHGIKQAVMELSKNFDSERIHGLVCDCRITSDLEKKIQELQQAWGGLDCVIANVGDGRSVSDPIPESNQWSQVWNTNFETALGTARVCVPLLQATRGCLLFIASITGLAALGAPVDYSVAKTAVIALAQNLARKVAPQVRINVIAPGNVCFPGGIWEDKLHKNPDEVKEMLHSQVPLQRFATPDEIADAAVFLCSPRASFITGSVLRIDGGQLNNLL